MFVDRNNAFDYAMYTDTGNAMIHGIVVGARVKGLLWNDIVDMLRTISDIEGYGEAMDTAVREEVWCAVFGNKG